MTFDGLTGLFGQRDMPAALRDRIAADIKEVMADPAVASRFVATGQLVSPGTATDFAASMKEQQLKLAEIAKQLGIKPQ
jgi:tripartite-type tricarboxylate transporter receptor subunit TctC